MMLLSQTVGEESSESCLSVMLLRLLKKTNTKFKCFQSAPASPKRGGTNNNGCCCHDPQVEGKTPTKTATCTHRIPQNQLIILLHIQQPGLLDSLGNLSMMYRSSPCVLWMMMPSSWRGIVAQHVAKDVPNPPRSYWTTMGCMNCWQFGWSISNLNDYYWMI